MDTIHTIKSRRSIKHFDPHHKMPNDTKQEILSLATLSPTAFNLQHWRFVVIEDKELRNQIKEAAWGQSQVTDSSLFIVLCADLKAWEKEPLRYWKGAPKEVQEFMLPAIENYYKEKDQTQRDEAMRSCGIAAQTLMLSAKALGYDSCPMDGFDFDAVGQLINLPQDHVIVQFVAIGKGIKDPWPRQGQLDLNEVVINNRF
ncbi:MAG: nitroreductase family protein [Rickettsiales bacterium]|nr:nitroreductase family protein [Rickettsiales bacterium]